MSGPTFGEIVAATLSANGWSQSDLARRIGLPPQRVQSWLHGHQPSVSSVVAFAEQCADYDAIALIEIAYDVRLRS